MARDLRLQYPGAVYHIFNRGNHKEGIFLCDQDFKLFLELLAATVKRANWICHAYCLMPNHYHLMIQVPDGILSDGMAWLNGVYTQKINRKYDLSGHLFQGRYKSKLVDGNMQFLLTARYIARNPLEAKKVENLSHWTWSSYHATVGDRKPDEFLTVDDVLGNLSADIEAGREVFREFAQMELSHGEDAIIRMTQKIYQQKPLPPVESRVRPALDFYGSNALVPRKQRILSRPALKEIFADCRFRNLQKRNARIYEAFQLYGYKQSELAAYLGLHQTTISRIITNT